LLEPDFLLELCLGIESAVAMVLHGHRGHLLGGGAVLGHVGARHQSEDTGKGESERLLPQSVGGVGEVLRRLLGGDVEHPLGPADQHDVGDPGGDFHHGMPEGRVRTGASGLETRGGNGR